MGSPKVFQTAPPQPASNARITCSPQFAGGPDASQNGFGQRIPPAKFVERSAIVYSQRSRNPERCTLAIGNGVHHLAAAIHAIATSEVARIRGRACRAVHHNAAALQRNATTLLQQR